jgi:hypothetical protein
MLYRMRRIICPWRREPTSYRSVQLASKTAPWLFIAGIIVAYLVVGALLVV